MVTADHRTFPVPNVVAGAVDNVHWMVPRNINSLFTGRSELVDRIRNALSPDQNLLVQEQRRFVITGMGGQGKSEVCLKVVYLMQQE